MAILCLAAAPAAYAELLPEVSVRLLAARYVPARTDFHWQGWIGAGAGLVRVRGTTAYFDADVETIVGDTLRTVDANQANYHLEAGIRQRAGARHGDPLLPPRLAALRRPAEDPGRGLEHPRGRIWWPVRPGARPVAATVSLGHTTLASLVGYRWEAIAEIDAEPARIGSAALFGGQSFVG